jgi:DNA-binding MarR family transcriptional regulator
MGTRSISREASDAVAGPQRMLQNGRPSAESIAMLRADARFADAARAFVTGVAELYEGNRLLNTLVNDRGRFVMGFAALYMHYHGDPRDPGAALTASRIKEFCVEQNICSPGRAEAMLMLMRLFGYLEPSPSTTDRRLRILVATERLIESFHQRWERMFGALALVLPEGRAALPLVRQDSFSRAFVGQAFRQFKAGFRFLDYAPDLSLFADRNSGLMIVFSLFTAEGPHGGFPPERPVSVSISSLARRFGVSRVHVRKLLRDAEMANLIARSAGRDDQIVVQPRLREAGLNFIASMFLFVAHCIDRAIAEQTAEPRTAGLAAD